MLPIVESFLETQEVQVTSVTEEEVLTQPVNVDVERTNEITEVPFEE